MLGLTKREIAAALRRDRRLRRAAGVHRRAGEDLLVRACTCGSASPSRSTSIPTCCSSTRCSRSATRASRTSASTSSPSSSAAARRSCSSRTRSAWSSASATRRCGSTAAACKAHGDPKRVVGAYLTDVEDGEETAARAPTTREAQESRRGGRRTIRQRRLPDDPIEPADATGRHVPGDRRTLGLARGRDHRRRSFSDRDGQPAHRVPLRRSDRRSASKVRAPQPVDDFVFGIGLFNADGVCCYGTNTYHRGAEARSGSPARPRRRSRSRASISSKAPTSSTSPSTSSTAIPYDYHRLLYTFRVKSRTKDVGIYRPRHAWDFSDTLTFARTDHD